jgi:hypothetical protein
MSYIPLFHKNNQNNQTNQNNGLNNRNIIFVQQVSENDRLGAHS